MGTVLVIIRSLLLKHGSLYYIDVACAVLTVLAGNIIYLHLYGSPVCDRKVCFRCDLSCISYCEGLALVSIDEILIRDIDINAVICGNAAKSLYCLTVISLSCLIGKN